MPSTEENEFFLWRTPDAHCSRGTYSIETFRKRLSQNLPLTLNDQVNFGGFWLTPTAADGFRSSLKWKSLRKGKVNGNLSQQAAHFQREEGGLNPAWVEQMMGFPVGWTEVTEN